MSDLLPCLLDYETQSACDLRACGSYKYAKDPTTSVLCAAILYNNYRIFWTLKPFNITMPVGIIYEHGYDFIWTLFHEPLFMIAHNVDFERPISEFTLKLPTPMGGWRDTMDQTLMRGLPAGADAAGQYLFGMGKDIDGYKLMMSTCKPKKDGTMPIVTDDVMRRYVLYNFRDVEIQKGITDILGWDIHPEWEQRVNQLHRDINHRGVQLDRKFAETLRSFDELFKDEARRQTEHATNNEVKGADLTRRDFILAWLASKGLQLDRLDKDTIEKVLDADEEGEIELTTDVYAVLTNRLVVSRAALAKVETAIRGACADGRLYALLKYWGARTGRWSGMRIQLQNMKRPNEAFDEDSVEQFTRNGLTGAIEGTTLLQLAIHAVETGDRELFTKCTIGLPPYELLSSLVRAIFIPRAGCVLIAGDFSQVEARGLLWWAEDFEGMKEHIDYDEGRGPDVYCTFASSIYRREITKKNKSERQAGKVGQLACVAEGTPVLTDGGWKPIEAVSRWDLIWDGNAFVMHEGVIDQGVKSCVNVGGVWATEDHLFLTEDGWRTAGDLLDNIRLYQSACDVGTCSLSAHGSALEEVSKNTTVAVTAGSSSSYGPRIFTTDGHHAAITARSALRPKRGCEETGTLLSYRIESFAGCGSTAIQLCALGVRIQLMLGIIVTAVEESRLQLCGKIRSVFSSTSSLLKGGIAGALSWIDGIILGGMSLGMFGWLRKPRTPGTLAQPGPFGIEESSTLFPNFVSASARDIERTPLSPENSTAVSHHNASSLSKRSVAVRTYDIRHCGPRNRFQAGSFLVHNCGYQGSVSAVRRMAYANGIDLVKAGVDEMTVVTAWRSKYPRVVDLWHRCDDAFRRAMRSPGKEFQVGVCSFTAYPGRVEMKLPSGRVLTYMNARLETSNKVGWEDSLVIAYDSAVKGQVKREELYGGKIVENGVQALCRDLLADAMLRVAEQGDEIVFHVHDEMIAEVPEEYAEEACASMAQIMRTPPEWGRGFPLNAKPEILRRYGK